MVVLFNFYGKSAKSVKLKIGSILYFPVAFPEYMSVDSRHPFDAWKDYYTFGGLPQVRMLDTDQKKADYLKNLYSTVLFADILERHKIKNKEEFGELVSVIASSIGSPTNPRKLSNTF